MTTKTQPATHRVEQFPEGHGMHLCPAHTIVFLMTITEPVAVSPLLSEADCLTCTAEREKAERAEYNALTNYQRGAYDYVGQRGATHAEGMEAARSI